MRTLLINSAVYMQPLESTDASYEQDYDVGAHTN